MMNFLYYQALVGRVCRLLSSSAIKAGGRGWTCRRMGTYLTRLTEEESMMKETGTLCDAVSLTRDNKNDGIVAKFAQEKVAPLVKEMDEREELDRSIIDGLFKQGVSDASTVIYVNVSNEAKISECQITSLTMCMALSLAV